MPPRPGPAAAVSQPPLFPGEPLAGYLRCLTRWPGRFGGIDVLHYSSPGAGTTQTLRGTGALDVTVDNLRPQIDSVCYGAITATRAVLPAMLTAGIGTLLYTTGASSVTPAPVLVSAGMAGAALRKWALTLNEAPPKTPRSPNPTTSHGSTGTSTPAAIPPNTSSPPDPVIPR